MLEYDDAAEVGWGRVGEVVVGRSASASAASLCWMVVRRRLLLLRRWLRLMVLGGLEIIGRPLGVIR